jgi:predicted amidophosphoribosyltransferase
MGVRLWVGVLFFGMIVVVLSLTLRLIVLASARATRVVNQCRRCGYDLRGLRQPRRCPECGQPYTLNHKGQPLS